MFLCSPDYLAKYARRFMEAGARLLGGCCGTTPEHIRALARAVKRGRATHSVSQPSATARKKVASRGAGRRAPAPRRALAARKGAGREDAPAARRTGAAARLRPHEGAREGAAPPGDRRHGHQHPRRRARQRAHGAPRPRRAHPRTRRSAAHPPLLLPRPEHHGDAGGPARRGGPRHPRPAPHHRGPADRRRLPGRDRRVRRRRDRSGEHRLAPEPRSRHRRQPHRAAPRTS